MTTNDFTIHHGDCIEYIKSMPDNSVDLVVTDPPYELGFMGKAWDKTGIANNVEMWKECLRVLKPGGYLFSFGGTRTYHRMACAIEDAGFEIRDMIEWVYGSGFPKSLNIGKAIDKHLGKERKIKGLGNHCGLHHRGGNNSFTDDNWKALNRNGDFCFLTEPATEEAKFWEGWGTALKPTHEPICMARKPLSEKTVAENVLKWGTGGLNIDESRVDLIGIEEHRTEGKSGLGNNVFGKYENNPKELTDLPRYNSHGRFPANLIHDGSEEILGCFPETKTGSNSNYNLELSNNNNPTHITKNIKSGVHFGDSCSAARFFKSILYIPKASKRERNAGCEELEDEYPTYTESTICPQRDIRNQTYKKNYHPTVKPIALMEYIINMTSRKGQNILDPFMGSGTTGVACVNLGRRFIGCEIDEGYFKIAKKRIEGAQRDNSIKQTEMF